MHTISAIAVALAEADSIEFIEYAKQIVKNAQRLAQKLMEAGAPLALLYHGDAAAAPLPPHTASNRASGTSSKRTSPRGRASTPPRT